MKRQLFPSMRLTLAAVALLATSLVPQLCSAQEDLPTADQVIAKFVEKTGGLEKYKAINSLSQTGTISLPAAGLSGTMKMMAAAPNKILVNVSLPGAGDEKSGSDGETVWSDSTMTGKRILTGKEREQILLEANFRRLYDPASVYESLKVIGTDEVEGEKCYKVEVVKKSGDKQIDYYSAESGLQVKADIKAQSPMGALNIETYLADYKDVNGILMPHRITQKFVDNGMEMQVEMSEIKINPELGDDAFKVPADIQKMIDKKKESGEDK
jgi:zinc protease